MNINNIFCVGRNYVDHAKELHNAVPTEPMIFTKPTHAVAWMNGGVITLPRDQGAIHYESELVLHIGRDYQPGLTADDLVDTMALGLDFTLRDVQSELKKKGYPWLAAKGFRNSAALTRFIPFPGLKSCAQLAFSMRKNGHECQRGAIGDMIFAPDALLAFCAAHYGLKAGDILYTGTPAGVGPLAADDTLALYWGDELLGSAAIELN
ncbi:MAG: fumarylacetoacetate hydrolase family protein [Sporolactobacillus sp.]